MTFRERRLPQPYVLALALVLLAVCLPSIASADFWWHLRTGQLIFDTHAVPHTDPFSFTALGRPWIAHEWLSELVMYLLYRLGGYSAILLVFSAVAALAFGLMAWRSQGAAATRIFALVLAVWCAHPTFSIRPQEFSLLLFALFYALLENFRRTGSVRGLMLLPPLALLWVNLHGGYVLGPALILLFGAGAAGDALARLPAARPFGAQAKALGLTLAACLLVVPVNPNGVLMYVYPFRTLHSEAMRALLMEWQPPNPRLPLFYPFFLLVGLGALALLVRRKNLRVAEVLIFAFFAGAALHSMRFISLCALAAIPVLAGVLPKRAESPAPKPARTLLPLQIAAVVLAAGFAGWFIRRSFAGTPAVVRAHFPVEAVNFLEQHHLPGRIFNSYDFGGYLIWRLYPEYRVFVDGRADVYGDAFLTRFVEIYLGEVNPRPEFDRLGIRTVIVEPQAMVGALLSMGHDWKIVYADRVAVILTRSSPAHDAPP
jgi:hypothetical protein